MSHQKCQQKIHSDYQTAPLIDYNVTFNLYSAMYQYLMVPARMLMKEKWTAPE
jgi:hypothetical protein